MILYIICIVLNDYYTYILTLFVAPLGAEYFAFPHYYRPLKALETAILMPPFALQGGLCCSMPHFFPGKFLLRPSN